MGTGKEEKQEGGCINELATSPGPAGFGFGRVLGERRLRTLLSDNARGQHHPTAFLALLGQVWPRSPDYHALLGCPRVPPSGLLPASVCLRAREVPAQEARGREHDVHYVRAVKLQPA